MTNAVRRSLLFNQQSLVLNAALCLAFFRHEPLLVIATPCCSRLLSVITGVSLLLGLARCGLPFRVVGCCSDLIRYILKHLLYFCSIKSKFFIVGGFFSLTLNGTARNSAEKLRQMLSCC